MLNHIPRSRRIARAALCTAVLAAFAFSSTVALAITRDEVLARGAVWVKRHTPYSQSRYATIDGSVIPTVASAVTTDSPPANAPGYRTDCSGFLSMTLGLTNSWGQPLSLNTRSLPSVSKKIAKADLKPGDMILKPGTHVVLFVRWANTKKTRYICYQERGTAYGTVATEVTYPYGTSTGYAPYRYNGVQDSRLRRSLNWVSPLFATGL